MGLEKKSLVEQLEGYADKLLEIREALAGLDGGELAGISELIELVGVAVGIQVVADRLKKVL